MTKAKRALFGIISIFLVVIVAAALGGCDEAAML
jgi:hypothetical protein